MDSGRLLILSTVLMAGGCASRFPASPARDAPDLRPVAAGAPTVLAPEPLHRPVEPVEPSAPASGATPLRTSGEPGRLSQDSGPGPSGSGLTAATQMDLGIVGRPAIVAANREARVSSRADAFVGGAQVFAFAPGRVYEIWTAPLRVTVLTLAAGERVTAKAAGDTLRWQIGEGVSGAGAGARVSVLIKPLESGLETNLVLTTSQRVYLLHLRSGADDAYNAAVAWDRAALTPDLPGPPPLPPTLPDRGAVEPSGPIDARYRIETRGRVPRWTPISVFNDGVRTFITLDPQVAMDEAPALFVMVNGEAQFTNYRQSGDRLIVDRVFEAAELRLGARRPQVVRIRRLEARR